MSEKKTAASTAPKTKDQLIEQYGKIVAQKEAEIASIEAPRWKTTCSFKATENSTAINLHTVKDVEKLTGILAFLIGADRDFAEAASLLGRTKAKFKHQGYTINEWTEDIRTEIGKIEISEKRKTLAELKSKLEALESQEAKEAKMLASIERELAGM